MDKLPRGHGQEGQEVQGLPEVVAQVPKDDLKRLFFCHIHLAYSFRGLEAESMERFDFYQHMHTVRLLISCSRARINESVIFYCYMYTFGLFPCSRARSKWKGVTR